MGSLRQRLSDRLLRVGTETAFDGEALHRRIEADRRLSSLSAHDRHVLDQHRAMVSFAGAVAVRLGLWLMPRGRVTEDALSRR